MPRNLMRGKCKMVSILDKNGNEYHDWRRAFVGTEGNAIIQESLKKYPGKKMLYYEINNDPRYIHTSCGELEKNKDSQTVEIYKLSTKNSTYYFILEDIQEIQPSLFDKEEEDNNV